MNSPKYVYFSFIEELGRWWKAQAETDEEREKQM
jgi:hypothetical protein